MIPCLVLCLFTTYYHIGQVAFTILFRLSFILADRRIKWFASLRTWSSNAVWLHKVLIAWRLSTCLFFICVGIILVLDKKLSKLFIKNCMRRLLWLFATKGQRESRCLLNKNQRFLLRISIKPKSYGKRSAGRRRWFVQSFPRYIKEKRKACLPHLLFMFMNYFASAAGRTSRPL